MYFISRPSIYTVNKCLYHFSVIPEVRRCTIYSKEGWKCNDGSCIPKQWICDKDYQCENVDDKSDEEEGCNLYPGIKIGLFAEFKKIEIRITPDS